MFWLVNSWIINHFGTNPESGGRPPKERRVKSESAVVIGVLDHEVAKEEIFVDEIVFSVRNMVEVMIK